MRREEHIDYHLVADEHLLVHERLTAWARWVRVRPQGWQVAPMFRFYRPDNFERAPATPRPPVNIPEAMEMEKAVSLLSGPQREVIRWAYFWSTFHPLEARANGWPHGPIPTARRLGVSKQGLSDLLNAARATLSSRLLRPDDEWSCAQQ